MSDVAQFIERARLSGLPYVTEVIKCLRDGSGHLSRPDESEAACDALLSIYERRVAHLSRFDTDHARIMKVDTQALCDALRKKKGGFCVSWVVEKEPYFMYSFFEATDDEGLFGVIKSVDNRKLSDDDRLVFWGTKKQ